MSSVIIQATLPIIKACSWENMDLWMIVFGLLLVVALSCGWLVWVSRFVWQDQKLAVRYAAIGGAATLIMMIIGMEKL
ncbi:MAG TPA: hypothetical protein EYQ70_02540 [Marine Group III euryarchaeote]|uniref:Uncharacterized protein n=1 Tax=Marine Group III euryarchaeote TaxID=2173149 RepID=A0A7J4GW38_9ARCH|nr:hypothetical protein [Marine Group III euryarchaeote]